jgi:hypothetical protein
MRRLLTVDAGPRSELFSPHGPSGHLTGWVTAFDAAGKALGQLAHDGTMHRGPRAVITPAK